ncbi:STAS domain-containing protein [Streptomyces sp. NPDC001914]|uniref:STAS domain-containing protein n=1 Tax=Streptomyces sp. NPDC001914 TaxID=3364623 RepID=UPI0036ADEE86
MQEHPYEGGPLTTPKLPYPDPRGATVPPAPGPSGIPTLVAVQGELDFVWGPKVRDRLGEALSASVGGLELDLAGLTFCDCSGLNVLLEIRHRAESQGKTVTIRAVSAAMARLLELVGVQDLFGSHRSRSANPRRREPVTAPRQPRVGVQREHPSRKNRVSPGPTGSRDHRL